MEWRSRTWRRWRAADFRAAGRPLHLVVSGFVDSGRVWEEGVVLSELLSDHHLGFGGGCVSMGENFVVALDLAHSREAGLPFLHRSRIPLLAVWLLPALAQVSGIAARTFYRPHAGR